MLSRPVRDSCADVQVLIGRESMALNRKHNQLGALTQPRSPFALFLDPLIPVNADVAGCPAGGDDVGSAVAVEIGDRQRFHRHAAVFDNVPDPFRSRFVEGLVDADAAPFAGLITEVVADTDDDLVIAVAVQVRALNAMSPL